MKRLKAYILFLLFCFSTVSSFATVHLCKGEMTAIEFVTIAACNHKQKQETSCHKHGCTSEQNKNTQTDDNDCCDTQQLTDEVFDFTETISPKLFNDLFFISKCTSKLKLDKKVDLHFVNYFPPTLSNDLRIKIQCFLI